MSSTRLEIAKERLALYYDAEKAILRGAQSYSIGSRNLTRADLSKVQDKIKELEAEVRALSKRGKTRRVARIVPVDR